MQIDGTQGEGGGQVLRSSLTLSLLTGKAVRIEGIRARRRKPGLQRQHLTAVRAAAEVGNARVEGAELGSQRLSFQPRGLRGGEFRLAIGTAGSCTLVLQTILPALLLAPGPSRVLLSGGTHNPHAPPADFLIDGNGLLSVCHYGSDITDHIPMQAIEEFIHPEMCQVSQAT